MGLFDPVRIPAQAGDWLMLKSFSKASPECVWITFLPIIAWRKETSKFYMPEFIDEATADRLTRQKEASTPWIQYLIRGGVVMDWNGEPISEVPETLMGLATNYRIQMGHVPAEFRSDAQRAVEFSIAKNPYPHEIE